MNIVFSLLILAVHPSAPIDTRHPDAVQMFHCGFEAADDREFDGWPDGWTRKRSSAHPAYLPARIVETPAPEGQAALRIDLNGNGAVVFSPDIEVKPLFSYVVEGFVKTEGLKHDRAWFSVTFYDEQHSELGTFDSQHCADNDGWRKLRVGPLVPPTDRARYAVIALHLEPGAKADLKGAALFDDLWLARLPRMSLSTNSPHNVFTDPSQIEITCRVSGIFERDPVMHFELVDFSGNRLDQQEQQLGSQVVAEKSSQASLLLGENVTQAAGFAGTTTWKPPISQPGFYRVHVTMQGRTELILERDLTLAVIEPAKNRPRGEFGWSLPEGDATMPLAALGQLLPRVGINWVKFPVWVADQDSRRLDQIVNFAERLNSQRIEMVGLLANPPADVRGHFGAEASLTAADIFTTEQDLWYRSLEPVLTRLSLQVRWWQLGLDGDLSFVGYPRLVDTIAKVKQQLQRYGQEIHLGFGWRIFNQPPADKEPPWDFLQLTASPPLTAAELTAYLSPLDEQKFLRWVSVQPLDRNTYSTETRAGDLIHRMLAAKVAGAEAIFIPHPFDPQSGVMNDDGTPSEMLLPWRTAALALTGAEYMGSLQLPSGSHNHIFVRDDEVVMIVWADRPVEEVLYLGDDVRQLDVWGRMSRPRDADGQQVIEVGPLPSFVTGLCQSVIRWNMAVRFEHQRLPSICGVPHANALTMKNFFAQGIGGQARLVGPDVWKIAPRTIDFKLSNGEEGQQPFSVALPLDAASGRQPIRIDFEISADRHYQFSVYRHLDVGMDDVTIDATSQLNDKGELEVIQQVTNRTPEAASFKCMLFAPNRRRMMSQVIELRQDRDTKVYRLPKGAALIGETLWLRAEEIGGQRTLNFRFVAEK
jgi:hypothetical protein